MTMALVLPQLLPSLVSLTFPDESASTPYAIVSGGGKSNNISLLAALAPSPPSA